MDPLTIAALGSMAISAIPTIKSAFSSATDPTSEEFRKRQAALTPGTPEYQSAFKGAEEATFGALGQSGRVGAEQASLAEALRAQAEGRGPSLAQMQYKQALEQSQAAAASQLASARGLSPAQAQQMLMVQQAGARQAAAGQSAQLRLQEQMAAQAALGNLLGQRRQQELLGGQLAAGLYGTAGGLGVSAAQMQQRAAELAAGQESQEAARQQQFAGSSLGAGATLGAALLGAKKQARGGVTEVPGKAKFKGDTRSNDTVPALLSPGEIVLPRSVAQDEDAPDKAKQFVAALKKQKRPSMKSVAQAMARLQELEARMDALEALSDLEAEQEG